MFFMDPARGRTRRSTVRDRAVDVYGDSMAALNKTTRNVRKRATGIAARTRAYVKDHLNLGSRAEEAQEESTQSNWTPVARLAAGLLGSGLAVYGLRSPSVVGKATGTLGLGLMARGITTSEWTGARKAHSDSSLLQA